MKDNEFILLFENCTLSKQFFNHRGHLRICWLYLKMNPYKIATQKIMNGILKFAESLNAKHIFHVTLTLTWIKLVHTKMGDETNFEDFIEKHLELLNKHLPYQYYSEARLKSELAKKEWLEPDLKSL